MAILMDPKTLVGLRVVTPDKIPVVFNMNLLAQVVIAARLEVLEMLSEKAKIYHDVADTAYAVNKMLKEEKAR